ncbi:MAG TPA: hypothetical protein VFB54_11290, partial [Burkholderiales bacterium]|nr:hypothetical protein [Burkholderiales bacterium]
ITQTLSGSLGRIYVQSDDLLTVGAGGIVQNNGNPGAEMGLLAASGIAIDGRVLDGAYAVGLKTTNGDITLGSGGYLQAGALSVSAPNGSVALISSSDAIGVVAGKSSGDFAVNDNVGTMVVGTVTLANNGFIGQQSGIASTSGDVALQNTGSIYLANALSISTVSGNVGVNSTGGYIHQAGSGTVSATGMSAYAFGDVALMANNSVGTIAGQAGGGNFDFNDTGTLTVGSVASVGGLVASQNGIKTFNYRVGLTAAQDITVAAVIDSGTQTTTLTSNSGSISEAGAGAIQAGTLSGSSNGSTSLNGANTIGTLGSFSSAGFSLNDSVAIALGNPFTLNFPSAPTTGQTYTLVTAPSVSGTLTPTTVTGLSAGQSANFSYPPGQVILTISGPATPVRLQDFGVQ